MRVTDFDKAIIEAWAAYEIFRDLGFGSDDINFIHTSGDRHVAVALYPGTPREFLYSAGHTTLSKDEFTAQWEKFSNALCDGSLSDEDLGVAYSASSAVQNVIDLLAELDRKGIRFVVGSTGALKN